MRTLELLCVVALMAGAGPCERATQTGLGVKLAMTGKSALPASNDENNEGLPPAVTTGAPLPSPGPSSGPDVYQATLRLKIGIDERGNVSQVQIVKPLPVESLQEKALETVRTWKFRPAMNGAIAVPAPALVSIRFHLTHPVDYNANCRSPFAVAATQSVDAGGLTWEDFPDEIDHWLAQKKDQAPLSNVCQAAPPAVKYAIIWQGRSHAERQEVSLAVGSSFPRLDPEWTGKGTVEAFAMFEGQRRLPALFTSRNTSCETGLKAALIFLANKREKVD